jgi:hypothetical protein
VRVSLVISLLTGVGQVLATLTDGWLSEMITAFPPDTPDTNIYLRMVVSYSVNRP